MQAAELAPLVYGVILVLVILLAPAGIVGTLRGLLRSRRAGSTTPTATPDVASTQEAR